MDKEFWAEIAKNDYKIPEGYTLEELTETLFGFLYSTDSELRDDIAYVTYANWLKREMYSKSEIRVHVNELLGNLDQGIGEPESDSVFLRTFSILLLAEIIYNDNKKSLLERDQVQSLLVRGLRYLEAEKDSRGHIPVKGWAHALAHTADLMLELAKNRFTGKEDLEKILRSIAKKLVHSTNWIYIHGEDDRLANAVTAILQRDLLTMDEIGAWIESMTKPDTPWVGAWMDEARTRAFGNIRNFVRSVFLKILSSENLPRKAEIQALMMEATTALVPY